MNKPKHVNFIHVISFNNLLRLIMTAIKKDNLLMKTIAYISEQVG
jgi:hypothetical protein